MFSPYLRLSLYFLLVTWCSAVNYWVNHPHLSPPSPLSFSFHFCLYTVFFPVLLFFPENEPISFSSFALSFFSHHCFLCLLSALAHYLFKLRTHLTTGPASSSHLTGTFPEIRGRSKALSPEAWVDAHHLNVWSSAFRAEQMTEPFRHTEIFPCTFDAITKQTNQNKTKKRM